MPDIRVRCPAKINLGLRVSPPSPDGYHNLFTVFQTIALYDELMIGVSRSAGKTAVTIECDIGELATPANLAVRAAEAVLNELRVARGVRLVLKKRIPTGAGLGGGSSDAAGVLRVLPGLLRREIPLDRLMPIAACLGADVPFFLLGGRAVGRGRGTELYPLPEEPARPVIVVHPAVHVSTKEAYRLLDEARARAAGSNVAGQSLALTDGGPDRTIYSFCASVIQGSWTQLGNDFELVVFSAYPELARLKGLLKRAGASPALLSGSGSAVFAVFDSVEAAHSAAARVREQWPGWRVWITRTVSRRQLDGTLERTR